MTMIKIGAALGALLFAAGLLLGQGMVMFPGTAAPTIAVDSSVAANACKNNGSGVTTLTITCSPTTGSTIVVGLNTAVAVTAITVKDNNNNTLTAGPVITSSTTTHIATFYGTVIAGATSYVASWTTSATSSLVGQSYTGVTAINASLAGNTASGSSASASITVTTEDANDWVVCVAGDAGNTLTATVGTSRQQVTAGSGARQTLLDNTVVAAGSVTCTATLTSAAWAIAVIELRT